MSAIPAQVTKSAGVMAAESLEGLSALAQDGSKSVAGVVKVAAVVGGIAGQVSAGPQARSLCTSTTAHHHHTTTFPLYDQPCFSPAGRQ